ncbi:ornithine cyclodeaminase family protein [Sphingomonas sp. CGMCC 1.13654]|uniref:Ornithine cyclodeaminase family protein n=1 Tax=Sphingomonas chungangi TaxID=2683589 RepID=A0A838L3Q2_9SPHN|nr:ornithine cyclodeaminase family protein [Sphingomonas chungangi]MVW54883.1 ornithine cyclodeaminase family protein [Sphingomonas chungangi]
MPVHLDREALVGLLAQGDLNRRVARAFVQPAAVPVRQRLDASRRRELLVMPAYSGRFAGVKILTVVPENVTIDEPVISGLFLLFDFESGAPLATMDAGELTAWRTAAVSAIAADALAKPDATRLTVLGSGHLAPYLAAAHARIRPIEHIAIWARRPDQAERVASSVREDLGGVPVEVCTDIERAVRSADLVSAATRATAPLIRGEWLAPGVHVDLVGGYRPDMREIDDHGITRGPIFVDSIEGALAEAGDLIDPIERGVLAREAIAGDLAALISGRAGRGSANEITIFKSVGTALADLAAAVAAWERSQSASIGADAGKVLSPIKG